MKYILVGLLIVSCVGCTRDGQSPAGKSSNFKIVTLSADTIHAEQFVNLRGSITTDLPSSATIISRGMCWDTLSMPTIDKNVQIVDGKLGRFTAVVDQLYPKQKYYARAFYEIFPNTPVYGNEISFTVPAIRAYGVIQSVTPSRTGVVIKVTVYWNGGGPIQYQGLEYYKSGAISTIFSPNTSGAPDYFVTLTSLSPNTTYFYRSYVVNEAGAGYAETFGSFTTLP